MTEPYHAHGNLVKAFFCITAPLPRAIPLFAGGVGVIGRVRGNGSIHPFAEDGGEEAAGNSHIIGARIHLSTEDGFPNARAAPSCRGFRLARYRRAIELPPAYAMRTWELCAASDGGTQT